MVFFYLQTSVGRLSILCGLCACKFCIYRCTQSEIGNMKKSASVPNGQFPCLLSLKNAVEQEFGWHLHRSTILSPEMTQVHRRMLYERPCHLIQGNYEALHLGTCRSPSHSIHAPYFLRKRNSPCSAWEVLV